jgi:cytochrome b6-f complex subunit 4
MEEDPDNREKAFYPDYLSEILVVIIFTIGAVFILAMISPPSVGREISFVSAYQPKPEWYFLWLYQLVRYFPGRWAFAGTLVVPFVFFASFLCMPFIDRGTERDGRIASLVFSLLAGILLILTMVPALLP